jgi:predicted GH43/DUF377 family glycosyl hydrolase
LIQGAKLNINIPDHYPDIKDATPIFDGYQWHIYGSTSAAGTATSYGTLHLCAEDINGPWTIAPISLENLYIPKIKRHSEVCAPGVIFDATAQQFHMFIHTHFSATGGVINHLVSDDGMHFEMRDTAIHSYPNTFHAGVYDAQPAIIAGRKYLTYTAFRRPSHGNIFLAESVTNTWSGPWIRRGIILSHRNVITHHNQHRAHNYEWGLEGSQLLELPDGKILLIAVCFLPKGENGRRQRIFAALASHVRGPYTSLGPLIPVSDQAWDSGENGHGGVVLHHSQLYLFYQARGANQHNQEWRYGLSSLNTNHFSTMASILG